MSNTGQAIQGLALRPIILLWLAVCTILLIVNWAAIRDVRFPDPDDTLRLLQVRDWMAGQSWFDVTQYRMNAPAGGPMHWSRLVDIPIAATIGLFALFMPLADAEILAMVIVPLLTLLAVMVLSAILAYRLAGPRVAIFACILLPLLLPVLHQLRPMRIDHHGWQMALALVALIGFTSHNMRKGGLLTGLALGVSLMISLEALPLATGLMAYGAFIWLIDPQKRHWLIHAMAGLSIGTLVIFLATRIASTDAFASYCDAMTPVHIAVFTTGWLGLNLLSKCNPVRPVPIIIGFAAIAGAGLAIMTGISPQCATGAFAQLDPVVREFWYNRVFEGQPVWTQSWQAIAQIIIFPLIGLASVYLTLAQRTRNMAYDAQTALVSRWARLGFAIVVSFAVSLMVERASAVASLFALPAAAALLLRLIDTVRSLNRPVQRIVGMVCLCILVMPGMIVAPASAMFSKKARISQEYTTQIRNAMHCGYGSALEPLNQLPVSNFMVPLDTGPAILYDTGHKIVASGHHRNDAAMRDIIEFFRGDSARALQIISRRNIDYVGYCPGLAEPMMYRFDNPQGMMAQLFADTPPQWLEPVALPGLTMRLWKVRKDKITYSAP